MSRRLTPEPPVTTWVVLGLFLFGFIVFYPALRQLPLKQFLSIIDIHALLPGRETQSRVWVHMPYGTYYCAGSRGYRTLKPGEYMSEARARQLGFRPALNACSEKSLSRHIGAFDMTGLPNGLF